MAGLFSKSTIKKEVASFDGMQIDDKIAIVRSLYQDYQAGLTKDETRYEQVFNELFFHQLLGYAPKTHYHPKASTPVGSKIADVGLGFFEEGVYTFDSVRTVVELKGSKTFLDKKQKSYGGQSPVDQGFGYKTSFKHCSRLIVSNFASIRLYKDNKQDYEVWTLEELASGDDDWFALKKLLALLSRQRLIHRTSESYTEKLLHDFRYEQEKITKKFYAHYKSLRLELINDIRSRNTDLPIHTVVEKSQKIIDRIIFIHFCEDKGLLPEDKFKSNVMKAQEVGFTPREILQKFFHLIHAGSPNGEIPEYNGGLFAADEILNDITVGDAICRKFVDMGKYDFDDELSVNILGHIFEQSISDLEQLKIDLIGTETGTDELIESKVSKRKKDGIFYTPEYIVDYIVQNSLMTRLEEQEESCLQKVGKKRGGYKTELEAYQAYQHILQNVKVLDPACGSGAFLVKVFDYLYAENARVGEIIGGLFDTTSIYKSILRNNIYGVDLNPESVEITKLSLWLKSAEKNKKLNNLDANIRCGNSLIDDPEVAGDKAFKREEEFAEIMSAGGFDVVVGNPPYGAKLNKESLDFCKTSYKSVSGHFEIYYAFMEKGIDLIDTGGKVGYIVPNSRTTNKYAAGIRNYLFHKGGVTHFINFYEKEIFKEANIETLIFIFQKGKKNTNAIIGDDIDTSFEFNYSERKKGNDIFIYLPDNPLIDGIISKINKIDGKLSDYLDITIGYKPYQVGYGANLQGNPLRKIDVENKIYHSDTKINKTWKKETRGKNIGRYTPVGFSGYVKRGPWLMSPKDEKFYTQSKILIRRILGKNFIATLDIEQFYVEQSIYTCILKKENQLTLLQSLLGVISSSLISFYFRNYFSEKAQLFPQIKTHELKKIPIKEISNNLEEKLSQKVKSMLTLNQELHETLQLSLDLLTSKYGLEKISRKLAAFHELEFAEFKKQLKVKNSLSMTKKNSSHDSPRKNPPSSTSKHR